jgi:phospholipid/cholesterol/gamma-HCH transport system permease protein
MQRLPAVPAALIESTSTAIELSESSTAQSIGPCASNFAAAPEPLPPSTVIDGTRIAAFDTVGVWLVQRLL